MCGILGIVGSDSSPTVSDWQLIAMRDRMAERGPDDATILRTRNIAFAHRRLAIRDKANGRQPWISNDGNSVLVYNGEIYNDEQLRCELRPLGFSFHTQCDTEVLMAAWLAWGQNCVDRLRGMFAFGVYDLREQRLFLARDRCGVKPLFFSQIQNEFVFASSIAAITQHPRFRPHPNLSVIRHYLTTMRLTLGSDTVFEGVQTLLPAERVLVNKYGTHRSIYWAPPTPSMDVETSFEEAVDDFNETLRESISIRMRSDVPVGMMLSGGVDSSTLACLAKDETGKELVSRCGRGCRTGDFETSESEPDDADFAIECANLTGFQFENVTVDADTYLSTWKMLVESYETPVATPTDAIIYHVSKSLRETVGVALGGEGADEACCGYVVPHWSGNDYDLSQSLGKMKLRQASVATASLLRQYGCQSFPSLGEQYLIANGLISCTTQSAIFNQEYWPIAYADGVVERFYNQQLEAYGDLTTAQKTARLLLNSNLECLLARLDSATMLASLESRVPYTDHKLIEQLYRLPHSYHIDLSPDESSPWRTSMELAQRGSIRAKRLIRSLAGEIMPPHLANRPKASFPTPLPSWLCNEWKNWVRHTIETSDFARCLFRPSAIAELTQLPSSLAMWNWPIVNTILWGERWFA